MATLKNITFNDTGALILPIGATAARPGVPDQGMIRYNSSFKGPETYALGDWKTSAMPYAYRQIITTAYTAGGYANSVAWNNVNRTVAATDTTTNLGDNSMERIFNYQAGASGSTNMFIFGAANAYGTASNYMIAYNMVSEVQVTTGFSRTLSASRYNSGIIFQETTTAWNAGGGSAATDEFNFTTQTITNAGVNLPWSGETWGMSTENYGIFYTTEAGSNFIFSTRTHVSRSGTQVSAYHQQKSVQSKFNYCYAGNEGTYNGGNRLRRTTMTTNTTSGSVPKPITNSGEENLTLGQDWQYTIGMYDGAQNNRAWRFTYATETGFEGASTMQPKGKTGASSASTGWRP